MPTNDDITTKLELHGATVRDRCAELFTRSGFDRLLSLLMPGTFVAVLIPNHRRHLDQSEAGMADCIVFAERTLRDCRATWSVEHDSPDQDGIGFFRSLVRSMAADFRFCMNPDVEAF